jgi:transposase
VSKKTTLTKMVLSGEQVRELQEQLKVSQSAKEYQRIVALLAVHEGQPVSKVAKLLGVTRQVIYYWYATRVGQQDLNFKDAHRTGRPKLAKPDAQAFIEDAMRKSPSVFGYAAWHWTLSLLQQHIIRNSSFRMSIDTLRRVLLQLGYAWCPSRNMWRHSTEPASPTREDLVVMEYAVVSSREGSVKKVFDIDVATVANAG